MYFTITTDVDLCRKISLILSTTCEHIITFIPLPSHMKTILRALQGLLAGLVIHGNSLCDIATAGLRCAGIAPGSLFNGITVTAGPSAFASPAPDDFASLAVFFFFFFRFFFFFDASSPPAFCDVTTVVEAEESIADTVGAKELVLVAFKGIIDTS